MVEHAGGAEEKPREEEEMTASPGVSIANPWDQREGNG